MNSLKVLIALAIIWIGISGISVALTYCVASGELRQTGIGQLDFSLTYDTAATPTTQLTQHPIITAVNNGALLVLIQGVTITNADAIDSFLVAQSTGGDVATTGLDVTSTSTNGADASVKNYNMYGYVTYNYAYAGQYADSITGESIDLNSQSWNKASLTPAYTPPATVGGPSVAPFTGFATIPPWGVGPAAPGVANTATPATYSDALDLVNPTLGVTAGTSQVEITAVNAGGTDTSVVSVKGLYQFAQAGGSQDPTVYPKGIWTQAVNDKGFKMTGTTNGVISDSTQGVYNGLNELSSNSTAASLMYNGPGTLSSNAQEMGYSDPGIVYANEDTILAGNVNTPNYSTTSTTPNLNPPYTAYSTADAGGNTPVQTGQKELFTYSIVNAANPNGFSSHLFF